MSLSIFVVKKVKLISCDCAIDAMSPTNRFLDKEFMTFILNVGVADV